MDCHQLKNAAPAFPCSRLGTCPRLGAFLEPLMFLDGDLLSDPHMPSCSPLALHMCFSSFFSLLLLSVLHWLGCNNNPPPLTPLLPLLVWVFSPIILLIFCP